MERATAAASPPCTEDGWGVKKCLERTWVCQGDLKEQGESPHGLVCVQMVMGKKALRKKKRVAQGRGAVSFPGGLSQSEGNSLEETAVVMKTG